MTTATNLLRMIRPPVLRPGDAIAVVAPAGPFDEQLLQEGAAIWRAQGFDVRLPEDLNRQYRYLAGDDEHRLAILQTAINDPETKAIVAARGGYGSLRMLDRLECERLQKHPKVIVGFSDVTALQLDLWRRCHLVTFSGPMMASHQTTTMDPTQRVVYFDTLTRTTPPPPLMARHAASSSKETVTGWLTGGNLTLLCHMAVSRRLPDLRGAILLIEDINEAPYRIDRALTSLRLGGHLDGVAGVVCGDFGPDVEDTTLLDLLLDCLGGLGVPILAGVEYGHQGHNRLVPLGVPVELDSRAHRVRFLAAGVC